MSYGVGQVPISKKMPFKNIVYVIMMFYYGYIIGDTIEDYGTQSNSHSHIRDVCYAGILVKGNNIFHKTWNKKTTKHTPI